ncbi:MAG: hypothetical protein J0H50_09195 [Xanthomonadales bacterium]|nr:hypothetical protein [Xanthomonadales bacterium]
MSGLGEVRIRKGDVAAWALLVALLLGLAACSSKPATSSQGLGADGQGPGLGADTDTGAQPTRPAPADTGAHAAPPAPTAPAATGPSRASAARPAARPPDAIAAPHPQQPTGSRHARRPVDRTHAVAGARPPTLPQTVERADAAAPSIEAPEAAADLASYVARVSATDHIELPGSKGLLTVWIGLAQNLPQESTGTVSATQSMGMRGQTATISPFAPDFEVDPASTVCERVVPSGSAVNFALVPKRAGDLTVGANVQLFDSADCSGVPVPKSTSLIRVQVQVCRMCYVQSGLASLGLTAWHAFTQFWAWLLGVVFLTLGVLINRWRRRRFHISKADEASGPGGGS